MARLLALVLVAVAVVDLSLACEDATSLIEAAEGFRACTYVDTTGHKTICYGFNLDASGAKSKVEAVGGDWNKVYNDHGCLSKSQCEKLLSSEVSAAKRNALSIFGSQCSCVQAVLTDMTYNLGYGGMASFHQFIALIKSHSWSSAAEDARHTAWCGQVGNRCSRDTGIIARGCGAESTTLTSAPSLGLDLDQPEHSHTPVWIAGVAVGAVAVVAVAVMAVRASRKRSEWTLVEGALVADQKTSYGTLN